jgi:hypothetical protein
MLTEDAKRLGIHVSQKGENQLTVTEEGTVKIAGAGDEVIGVALEPFIDTADTEDAVTAKIDLEDMGLPELKKYAKHELGIKLKRTWKKEDVIEAIKAKI